MKNKCRKKGVSTVYIRERDAELQRDLIEFEIADKIAGLARLLDISVPELRELVPVEDDFDLLHEMFRMAIEYREKRKRHEVSGDRRRASKRDHA